MMDNNIVKTFSNFISNSVSFKIITIFTLILILLMPTTMMESLIREREHRNNEVINEISSKWGQDQIITGPIISIPYKKFYTASNGKITSSTEYLHFLPDHIDIKSEVFPEMRYRGIYEAVLYNSAIELSGSFSYPQIKGLNVSPENIIWSGAFISIGIKDMRGIKDQIKASFNNKDISMNPGIETRDIISSGISSKIAIKTQQENYPFKFHINLNGSRMINFVPVGKTTNVTMNSTWSDPSFDGAFLPVKHSIDENGAGFKAEWKVLHLNRNYPQSWTGGQHTLHNSAFGVNLFTPVDIYQKSTRTAKYALMFIVFTFMAFFISEVMNKLRVHPIQYLLVGLTIIVFYSLLISISEHINFNAAYLISSASVILLITGYAKSILNNTKLSVMVCGVLIALYSYMYTLLQLEDYALSMGSIGLFAVLSIIMYMTRKIDWYAIKLENRNE